jgi:hypothetical protein
LFLGLPGLSLSKSKVRNKVFFKKIFVLIGIFGVPIIFLRFWVELANRVAFTPIFGSFLLLIPNILF